MKFDSFYNLIDDKISDILKTRLNLDKLFELRLRVNLPATVNYGGKYYYLSDSGISQSEKNAVSVSMYELNEFIIKAGKYSVYAFNDQICNGYISLENGIRVGLAGEAVLENDEIKTIKNISSVNIRFPHEITGCSDKVIPHILHDETIKNALIISPPGCGKTTLLRDIARNLSQSYPIKNILIIDERNELAAVSEGKSELNVGKNVDIVSNCSKNFAFTNAIRAMRPDVIITDELFGNDDITSIENAAVSGVSVIASVHANSFEDLCKKKAFLWAVKKKLFQVYIVLKGVGQIDCVLNSEGESA